MVEPTTRTVTFLLTDVEGSTALWEKGTAAMQEALACHDALLTDGITAHGGVVVKGRGEGDSFFAVFESAGDAVAAAAALQSSLQAVEWTTTAPLQVRMALSTGEAQWRDGDYFGTVVNRGARLRAAAHGGQILVSQSTMELVRDAPPSGIDLRALGEHRFKDLARPEPVFQVVHRGLPAEFPPLRSLDALSHNLPRELTSFVGREREVAEVKLLLSTTRLLTLTGSGGVGKTRLVQRVAGDMLATYPDGIWLVELAALGDPALVPQAIASVLGVREQPGRSLLDTLIDVLRPRASLLLLDNCEHLIAACAAVANSLLRACPGLTLVATSREPLVIAGETVWRVPPLTLPDAAEAGAFEASLSDLTRSEAVCLFDERARAAFPAFALTDQNAAVVAGICRRLDGIPLAIELAAARIRGLALEQLASRLDDHLRLLTGGSRVALPRHQTLRALVDWSYALLSDPERILFRRLSVFAGGWTLEAAESICIGDGIEPEDVLGLLLQLVDRSLVLAESQPLPGGGGAVSRYRLLETLRQYGMERMQEARDELAVRLRHLDWCLILAEDAGAGLRRRGATEQGRRLEAEHDNLRAALGWCLMEGTPDGIALGGQRLAAALWEFWWMHGHLSEGRRWLDTSLRFGSPALEGQRRVRAKALVGAGMLAGMLYDYERADLLNEEALALVSPSDDPSIAGVALAMLAFAAEARGETDLATERFARSLSLTRDVDMAWLTGWQLGVLGRMAITRGDFEQATALLEESLTHLEQCGDRQGASWSFQYLGRIAQRQGDHERSRHFFEEALAAARDVGDKMGIAWSLGNLGRDARIQGNFAQATEWLEASLRLSRDIGDRWGAALSLGNLGRIALTRADYQRAAALFEESLVLSQSLTGRGRRVAYALHYLGVVAKELGQPARACRLIGAATALQEATDRPVSPLDLVERERQITSIRQTLGDDGFVEAWAAGQAMSLDQAIGYGLSAPPASRAPAHPPVHGATSKPAPGSPEQQESPLSARELEVAALLARGLTNRQVAESLVISERTATTHVGNILNKLGFARRSQIAAWAVEHALALEEADTPRVHWRRPKRR